MKRCLSLGALLVLSATTAACSFMFEDVGSDPHPPTAEIIELVDYVEPAKPKDLLPAAITGNATSQPQGRTLAWDSGDYTLSPGQRFQIRIAYTDGGGDIVKFSLRDRDGPLQEEFLPTGQTYFSGTSGTALVSENGLELTGIVGQHRLELWGEDSHGSRSEKVAFVINLTL